MIELVHFTEVPLRYDPERKYKQVEIFGDGGGVGKPKGLWLSDESDDGWKSWCQGEQWRTHALQHERKFICDVSNWIVLKSSKDIFEFTEKYIQSVPGFEFLREIKWCEVAAQYSGILITPYNHACRMNFCTFWYNGWDCASACVWDLSTIKEVK